MAHVALNGFESGVVAQEVTSVTTGGTGGAVAIESSIVRSGAYSLRVHSAPNDSNFVEIQYSATNVVSFVSVRIRVKSRPTDGPGGIIQMVNAAGTVCGVIAINNDGSLALYDGDISGTKRGSNSSVLTLDTWYIVQLKVEHNGSPELEARLAVDDGTTTPSVFASGTMTTATNAAWIDLGMVDFVTGFEAYFDDLVINNNSGSDQNSYPGLGKLVMARPTAAGDNAATAGLFSSVNESPVTDTVTSSANRIELDNNGSVADYNMTDSSTLGINSSDTIISVSTMIRIREEAAATTGYRPRLKSAASGTVATLTTQDVGNATLRTNPLGTAALRNALYSYTDPTTGVAWTPTGTNSIDNMQMGVDSTTANDIWVAWMGAYIYYLPASNVTTTKTIDGKARIQKAVNQTITGLAHVRKTVTQTITGAARIRKTVTQTITGKAAIRNTTNRTQTGTARIQKSVTRTIDGLSRIQKVVTQTITGKSRVTASTLKTIIGQSRITASTTKTQTGKAAVRKTVTRDIQGLSRIRQTVTKTVQGTSRITASVLRTITGKSRITASTVQTQTGKARVTASVDRTQTGKARVQKSVTQTITGVANISVTGTTEKTITGKARIQKAVSRTITGLSRIRTTVTRTVTGIARITASTTRTITGNARIQKSVTQTIQGVARIRKTTSRTVLGVARVRRVITQVITGQARITASVNRTQTGVSRIRVTVSREISGNSRITRVTVQTISGVAYIAFNGTRQKTIEGISRIQKIHNAEITGKARILPSGLGSKITSVNMRDRGTLLSLLHNDSVMRHDNEATVIGAKRNVTVLRMRTDKI